MQSRRPKPTKVGDKKSNEKPRSESKPKSGTSSPKFKKESNESEEPSTFNYLRRTNETASKDRKRPSKYKNNNFKNSFGRQSDEVMERANKRPARGSKSTPKSSKYESSSKPKPAPEPQKTETKSENSLKPWQRRGNAEGRNEPEKGGRFANRNQIDKAESPDTSNSWDNQTANKNSYNSPSFSRKNDDAKKKAGGTESSPRFKSYDKPKKNQSEPSDESLGIRLNRFIANCGVCARREADNLIEAGEISVNGKVTTDFSYRVQTSDSVKYGGKTLKREKYVYILLNKPKDFLTTTDDPEGRKSVMDLVKNATNARLYPVGRLDRNTTGLLLLTNDGDLTEKLMHPSHKAKKIYQVDLDRPFSSDDLMKVRNGVVLEDGPMKADDVDIVSPDRKCVGIEIHSGRNRIVRRIFEHLEYKIEKLDRVMYAGLTKKDLPRGTWRFLTEMEVTNLKYLRN